MSGILKRIWPWSKIARLEAELELEREFSASCMFYLDEIEPNVKHIRLAGKLYMMGIDTCSTVERAPSMGCVARGTVTEL